MTKRFITLLLLAVTACAAMAQQVSFEALPVRGAVRQGEKFAITFRLNNARAQAPARPQVSGCTYVFGPGTSSRESYSVVNGKVTSSSSVDYTFTFRADSEGEQTVGAVSVSVDGKPYSTKPFKIRVVKGSGGGADPGYGQGAGQSRQQRYSEPVDMDDINTQQSGRPVGSGDVFVRINLSKSQAYEQEAIVCTIKLYTKYQISSFMPTLQPSFDGFLIQELDIQPSLNEVESLGGQNYMTAVLKKCILFPQRSGKLTINSGNYDITVVQYERINMGLMTVSNPTERDIKVSSNKASVSILPLPQPQPAGFSGAVGSFKVDSRLVGNHFRTGDAATMIYTISGTGNIKYLKEPQIDFPSEFELYEPQSDIDAKVQGSNVSGTMTVNYTFVPQSVGNFRIGSDTFVYFDPAKKSYVTLRTKAFDIKVTQGSGDATARQDVTSKNKDILHIHTGGMTLSRTHRPVVDTWWYWLLYVVAAGVLGGVFFANRRKIARRADITGTRMARAGKEARKRLRAAETALKSGNNERFYEAVLQAMWGFLSDKLAIPQSQLTRENVSGELEAYGADESLRSRLITILDECEMARYTPVQSREQADKLYAEASSVIGSLSSLRRK
ncbi:MAG: BatD family protein [Candidatus Amulumruptor caecigallinarius]|nr:BatD family protein [Candidatus Amulumruptor caecigallinarius]MCM1396029.1 BatD family protein [Candidatus Amulumruptor caecigallinarius]MCM1453028.1 BatD family protein [bacterium]